MVLWLLRDNTPAAGWRKSARVEPARERGCVFEPMSANTPDADKDSGRPDIKTPDFDVPGLTDLSQLDIGDTVEFDSRTEPLTVVNVGEEPMHLRTVGDIVRHRVRVEHDRENARTIELVESINVADGSVIEIDDADDDTPVRLFAEADDE